MLPNNKLLVYECCFQLSVLEANLDIKFPCDLFVEWKIQSETQSVGSKAIKKEKNSSTSFNEILYL